jgi:alkylhydroperoxidase family enzyme
MNRVLIPDDVQEFPVSYVFRTYAPELGSAAVAFSRAVYERTQLSLREMEAARVRTAYINGCLLCKGGRAARDFDTHLPVSDVPFERPMSSRGAVPDEAFYGAIAHWRDSNLFTERERLAMEYAERIGEQPRSLEGDEDFWRRIRAEFDDRQLVDLTISISSWIALGRVMHVLELDNVCAPVHEMA